MDKGRIIEILKQRLIIKNNINYSVNGNKKDKCKITEINEKEGKIYLEHDYYASVKYLIKDRIGCYLDIDKIRAIEINIKENSCNIIYDEV